MYLKIESCTHACNSPADDPNRCRRNKHNDYQPFQSPPNSRHRYDTDPHIVFCHFLDSLLDWHIHCLEKRYIILFLNIKPLVLNLRNMVEFVRTVCKNVLEFHIFHHLSQNNTKCNSWLTCTDRTIANPFAMVASRSPITEQFEAVFAIVQQHHIATSQRWKSIW